MIFLKGTIIGFQCIQSCYLSWSLSVTQCQKSVLKSFECSSDLLRSSGSHCLCHRRNRKDSLLCTDLKASAFTIFGTCLWGEILAGNVLCCILFCSKAFKSGEQIQWMFSDLSYLSPNYFFYADNKQRSHQCFCFIQYRFLGCFSFLSPARQDGCCW